LFCDVVGLVVVGFVWVVLLEVLDYLVLVVDVLIVFGFYFLV